ncbi:hypothetical protein HUJ05_004236 [Dendroctonus ponderosae]|nr:hypothetical protein HUJ05_004236 [Dendroctonus ponderosae]
MDRKPIRKLSQEVINRIAAGEVIQRPANALKELIENSLDAKASNIQVTVKNGGLKLLQIQDNGTGIRKEDFEIVCERFTTSKLQEFEDLHKISTYGFRGEALASISHVAHLTIISKTKNDICAYQAEYCDSKLKAKPKPLAGNQGTIITVEDLFYNMNVRRNALRSPAEEYQKISDVVTKYAIHNALVGFALKKHGANNDIRTPVNSTHVENIRLIYGSSIARELLDFNLENDNLQFSCSGYMTNVNYSTKKFQFLLFINHRLVDSPSLKKCIDAVYQTYLPKNSHPFVYLSLELNPNNVDINVHPTKHEVHFLNETQVVESIATALEQKLLGSNSSRVFYTQSKLPGLQIETRETLRDKDDSRKVAESPKYTVRTDSNLQKLDKFFDVSRKNIFPDKPQDANVSLTEAEYDKHHAHFLQQQESFEDRCLDKTVQDLNDSPAKAATEQPSNDAADKSNVVSLQSQISASQEAKKCEKPLSKHLIKKITRVDTKLTSVLQLRKSVEENCHRTLRETFAQHVFVGSISPSQALIQYNTQLLLCNTKLILEELFYQLVLYNFQNFDCYRFENAMPIKDLALLGLDLPDTGWTEEDGPKEELAVRISEILTERGPMLREYFSINIGPNGMLQSLPILLENYIPNPLGVPLYLIRLATEVDWEEEKKCFDSFARETAMFYANVSSDTDENGKSWKWVTEYLFGKLINVDVPKTPNILAQTAEVIERGNFSYFYVYSGRPIVLNLTSILGDADLYISETVKAPTYDPETYSLHSATCGDDVVEVPESFEFPLAVGVYGYAETSVFLLQVQENPSFPYAHKRWVVIKKELLDVKEPASEEVGNSDSAEAAFKHRVKKKRSKRSSSMSSIYSVLEVLQLIFL